MFEGEATQRACRIILATRSLAEAVEDAVVVIEAVPEDIDLKVEVFGELAKHAKPEAILASNTSSLSITEMAAATEQPGRVVGMHFFNPVPRMYLLSDVRALETFVATIYAACLTVSA